MTYEEIVNRDRSHSTLHGSKTTTSLIWDISQNQKYWLESIRQILEELEE